MKNLLLLITVLLFCHGLLAQTNTKGFPLSIGYYSQLGFQPGAKISTFFTIKKWEKEAAVKKHKNLFISPKIGFFVRPLNHTNFVFGTAIGMQNQKAERSFFSAYSIGLNYQHQLQIQSVAVQLGEVNPTNNLKNRSYFLPTVNYKLGSNFKPNLGWYAEVELGQRIGGNTGRSSTILVGLGLQMKL